MRILYVILALVVLSLFLFNTACDTTHELTGGTASTVRVINPIIEFCERLYPASLYPDTVTREQGIVDCMQICSDSGDCVVDTTNIPSGTFGEVAL